jgi:hypothetical protein
VHRIFNVFHLCWTDSSMIVQCPQLNSASESVRASGQRKREREAIRVLCTDLEPRIDLLSSSSRALDPVLLGGLVHSNGGGIAPCSAGDPSESTS